MDVVNSLTSQDFYKKMHSKLVQKVEKWILSDSWKVYGMAVNSRGYMPSGTLFFSEEVITPINILTVIKGTNVWQGCPIEASLSSLP